MTVAQATGPMSQGLLKLAERAKRDPNAQFNSLAHLIDEAALLRAYERLRKDAAVGVDGVTVGTYGGNLLANIRLLLERMKTGRYRNQPIRRVHILNRASGEPRECPTLPIVVSGQCSVVSVVSVLNLEAVGGVAAVGAEE